MIHHLSRFSLLLNLLLAALLTLPPSRPSAQAAVEILPLFLEIKTQPDFPAAAHALFQYTAALNQPALQTALTHPGALLSLKLTPVHLYTARILRSERLPSGSTIFHGDLPDVPDSDLTLTWNGSLLAGSLNLPGQRFIFIPAADGLILIQQVDLNSFPEERTLTAPPVLQADQAVISGDDDGSQVDIMVVYTSAAKNIYGSGAAMQLLIEQAVAEANSGFELSQVNLRLRLVHMAEIAWDESGFNWDETTSRFVNKTDGFLDFIHPLRDQYAADIVSMVVVGTGGTCGNSFLMAPLSPYFESMALNVVRHDCMTGFFSLSHEAGHNMGSHHDRASAGSGFGAFPYSYGYQDPGRTFRTIMAYPCPGLSGCPRINRWSNPNVLYNGLPTGISETAPDSAYNALSLNNAATVCANFRDGPAPAAAVDLRAAAVPPQQVNLSWADVSSDETGFRLGRAPAGSHIYQLLAVLPPNTTHYVDTNVNYGAAYDYLVYAFSPNGYSNTSNTASAALPLLPHPPAELEVISTSEASVSLAWADTSDSEDHFNIQRSVDGLTNWTTVATSPANLPAGTDASPFCESSYFYRVTAGIGVFESLPSAAVAANTGLCTPTQAPAALSAAAHTITSIQLAWTDTPNETTYRIERSPTGENTWATLSVVTGNTLTYIDSGLAPGSQYDYRVFAANKTGESPPSPVASGKAYTDGLFIPAVFKR
ncbi:MAG TPA: fibronectin type III domain-containing protein [Anaerolineaceae bacterium]|nr:fibronectin type III domain-containing protein [Anaerolineaceae bacterium]HPN51600.1 fibronectin type III domain-containing protein [Anaerolineaceae bacterium]